MGNRYLVLSDLHLADLEDHPDGWKAYKSPRYLFDGEIAALLDTFRRSGDSGDNLTLVLNGDVLDFDLVVAVPEDPPWHVSRSERKLGLDATEPKSTWKLQRILSQHQAFVAALAQFVAAGHHVVWVLGNHDRELYFREVQQAFVDVLEASAREQGLSLVRGAVTFEEWFYYVPGEIYAEHGSQYDFYSSFRYLLSPAVELGGKRTLSLPMGNISNRFLMTRMGYFNPHASDYILNIYRYVFHWLRHYALSRRSLVFSWLWGSMLVISKLLRLKKLLARAPEEHIERLRSTARRYNLSDEEVEGLGRLQRPPITQKLYRIMREFWIDRLIIAFIMSGGTVALALVPIPLWIKLMVPLTGFPLLYVIYEWLAHGESIFTAEKEIPEQAAAIARLLPARVVTFGHTHLPRLIPLARGTTFVDTGTWAPIMDKADGKRLAGGLRNYLMASFHRGEVSLQLGSWMDSPPGAFTR